MSLKRREFAATVLAAGAAQALLGLAAPARAQGGPVAGVHYKVLSQPVATSSPPGKVEVVEFFWYGCPHCNAFEPTLDAWARKLPEDVVLKRVPVMFREEPYGIHQRLFYALETLGKLDAMHRKVFDAIHNPNPSERLRLDKASDIAAFMTKNGLDGAHFVEVLNSFGVQSKARQANALANAYQIDGVPEMGVQGRWFTSGDLAGGAERMLAVVDHLIGRARKSA